MELNFSPLRVAVLVILIAVFALLGGFSIPEGMPQHLMRSWSTSVLLFTLSAISATVVDHWIGNIDRSNLRWFYILVGVAGMAGSAMLQHVVQEQVPVEAEASSFQRQDAKTPRSPRSPRLRIWINPRHFDPDLIEAEAFSFSQLGPNHPVPLGVLCVLALKKFHGSGKRGDFVHNFCEHDGTIRSWFPWVEA